MENKIFKLDGKKFMIICVPPRKMPDLEVCLVDIELDKIVSKTTIPFTTPKIIDEYDICNYKQKLINQYKNKL